MACEHTSERVATLASDMMKSGMKKERSVAASAMRAVPRKNSSKNRYGRKRAR